MRFISDEEKLIGVWYPVNARPPLATCIKDVLGILSVSDNPSPAGRRSSFISLGDGSSKIQVEFEIICRRLRKRVLEAVARERYGDEAVRIIRFLLEAGKMNSDQVSIRQTCRKTGLKGDFR